MRLLTRLELPIFVALLLVQAVPIFAFAYFPSQDGPAHLANAVALREILFADGSVYETFYRLNPSPVANWPSHLFLAVATLALPPLAAEKLLLLLCALGLPLALRFALRAVRPDSAPLSWLGFLFTFNTTVLLGFYNFALSLSLYLLALGLLLRRSPLQGWRDVGVLSAAVTLLGLFHPLTFALTLGSFAVVSAWSRSPKQVLLSLAPFAPYGLAVLLFLGQGPGAKLQWYEAGEVLALLYNFAPRVAYGGALEAWLARAVPLLFAVLTGLALVPALRERRLVAEDGWLALATLALGLALLAPNWAFGGSFINYRLLLFPFFALALWLAARLTDARALHAVPLVCAALSIAGTVDLLGSQARLSPIVEEYASVGADVKPGQTLLAYNFTGKGRDAEGELMSAFVMPFKHAQAHIAAQRGAVDLHNYEAESRQFPLLFREGVDPFVHIEGLESYPPIYDFSLYRLRSGQSVDKVLHFYGHIVPARNRVRVLMEGQLRDYRKVATSLPQNLVVLYQIVTR